MSRIALIGENSIEYISNLIDIWNDGHCALLIDWRIPFEKALIDGCDKIIVVLTRPRIYKKKADPSVDICRFLYRKHKGFSKALKERAEKYNNLREKLFELEKEGKAIVIAPDNTDGWKRTERKSEKIKEMYDEGYRKAIKIIKKRLPL